MRVELPPMRPMDLDPTYVPYLEALLASRDVPIHLDDPAARRVRVADLRREPTAPPGVRISRNHLDRGDHSVAVRVYHPDEPSATRHPGLLYLHGGGWMYGSAEQSEPIAARYCREIGAVVVSPDYRLTPEHPFPAGFEDCLAVLQWLAAAADDLGVDADRLAIAGESSGANLAAACALAVRDQRGPALRLQVLNYPALGVDFDTPSYRDNEHAPVLSAAEMRYFWHHYLPGMNAASDQSPLAVPLLATVDGVAPALITTAEYDPLRDDGTAYATRLRDAGVECTLVHAPRLPHGFMRAWAVSADVADIGAVIVETCRRSLHVERP